MEQHSIRRFKDVVVNLEDGLPAGLFLISQILKYKDTYREIPDSILEYDKKYKIIMEKPTSESVAFRQQHPVLKKFCDIPVLTSQIMGALNMLSNDNFEVVVENILKIKDIDEQAGIKELANNLIKNVSNSKLFIDIYTQLCLELRGLRCGNTTLIACIANECKDIIDKYTSLDDFSKEKKLNDLDGKIDKTKMMNYIRFIGKLYNIKLFRQSVVEYCVEKIAKQGKNIPFYIEATTELVKTIFDCYRVEQENNLLKYIQLLHRIKDDAKTCKREKFMILNLLEEKKV